MDDVIKLLAALGPLIGGIGTTVGVLVVAFRKSNKERGDAAEKAANLTSVDAAQTEALNKILERLEKIEPSDSTTEDIETILKFKPKPGGGE